MSSTPPLHSTTRGDVPRLEFGRPALHPLEFALVAITLLHLSFLPWALGTMHAWSQLTSLGFSLAGFILATLPRRTIDRDRTRRPEWHFPLARLFRSPTFYAALILTGYLLVQALNPAWRLRENDDRWWLEPVQSISWLPSGVDAPFARFNTWRTLTIVSSLALLVSSVWYGFTRRRSYHALFVALAANAAVLALVGFIQRLSGTERIFGTYTSSNYSFVASFIYPNHGGCYFNLMTALSIGLAWWHYLRYRENQESPAVTVVAIWLAVLCAGLVAISYSRMSIALLITLILAIGLILLFRFASQRGRIARRPETAPLIVLLAALIGISAAAFSSATIRERFAKITADPVLAVQDRTLAREAAEDMFRDHWLTGWGAGCYRYGFSKYVAQYPAIHYFANGHERMWEHAHNDILEILGEIGVLGVLPIGFIACQAALAIWQTRFRFNPISVVLIIAAALVLVHSWVDFVFQNPAILLTWGVLLLSALRWSELDRPGAVRKPSRLVSREKAYIPERNVSSSA